jgi:hypothetical protein
MTDTDTRTYTPMPRTYVGDDAFITATLDTTSSYSTDVHICDRHHAGTATLHLSPFAVRELRDALSRCLIGLESTEQTVLGAIDGKMYTAVRSS